MTGTLSPERAGSSSPRADAGSETDLVVIGAGNAGLTAAATAQRGGLRTLLVERHNVPGGCATSFRRGRFEFEVALHQLSGVGYEDQPFGLRSPEDRLGNAHRAVVVQRGVPPPPARWLPCHQR